VQLNAMGTISCIYIFIYNILCFLGWIGIVPYYWGSNNYAMPIQYRKNSIYVQIYK